MKVLLWKIGALGDVVMTTPLVRQLRRNLPQARIDYLVGRSCAAVLQGNPHLDQVLTFDHDVLYRGRLAGLPALLAQLRGYDVVYVLDKHAVFAWLAWLARVPARIGFRRRRLEGWPHTVRVPYGPVRHEIQYYLDLAAAAGLDVDRDDVRMELPAPAPCELARPYVVASNSGGQNAGEDTVVRQLPPPLFSQLVGRLAASRRVVFVGSAAERDAYEPLAQSHGALNLCGTTSLPQVWGVLANAEAVYTTDNGLMHMAAAAGAPVVAVFGPTHPLRKAPPGARWVWRDEQRYDPRYELFGRAPAGPFFEGMRVSDIVDGDEEPAAPPADVDVVIATWNSAATLDACLRSVFEQRARTRVIVVDGGSRDGTIDIIRAHADRLAHWTSEPDRGVYDALNKGLRMARSPYVYILGSDDRLADPEALSRLLAGGGGADVVYGDVLVKEAGGRTFLQRARPLGQFPLHMPFSHQAVLVRRELALATPFGASLASDYRHLLSLYVRGASFRHVPGAVATYALGGLSDRHAVASTWDRWRINAELRGWRALAVLPFYLAQALICSLKPRLVSLARRTQR